MSKEIQSLFAELKTGLIQLYGERLKGVYLFGSYARGEQDRESDLDVLIVLDYYERYGAEINRTGVLISGISLKYGVTISRIFMQELEYIRGDTPLLRNLRMEAELI